LHLTLISSQSEFEKDPDESDSSQIYSSPHPSPDRASPPDQHSSANGNADREERGDESDMSMETVDPSEPTQAFGVHFKFPNNQPTEEPAPAAEDGDEMDADEMDLAVDDVTRAFRGEYEVPLHRPGVDEAAMAQIAEQQARNRSTRRSSLSFAPPSPAQNDEKTLEEEAEDLSMEMSLDGSDGSPTVDFGAVSSNRGRRLSERVRRGSLAPGAAGVALLDGEGEEDGGGGGGGSGSTTMEIDEEEDADRTMEMDETMAFASIYQQRQQQSNRQSLAAPPVIQQQKQQPVASPQDLLSRSPSPSKPSFRQSQPPAPPAPPATPSRGTPKSPRKSIQHSPFKHSPGRATKPAAAPNQIIPPSSLSRKPAPSPAFASPNKQRKSTTSASPRKWISRSPATVQAALPAGSPLASRNSGPLPSSIVKGNPASKRLAEIVADEEEPERSRDSFGSDGGVRVFPCRGSLRESFN
jgi:hypothetical protein